MRGPHVPRYAWFGYAGGLEWRRFGNRAHAADEENASVSADDETKAPSFEVDDKDEKEARVENVVGTSDIKTSFTDPEMIAGTTGNGSLGSQKGERAFERLRSLE